MSVPSFLLRPSFQIALLTALFSGGYYAMRKLPSSSCNFLHYDQGIVTADGAQFCGSGVAYFVDLDKLPFPVTVKLTGDQPAAVGQTTHYTLSLVTDDGQTLEPSQLAVAQTRKLHLLLVDPSLEDYQHIHPEPVGDTGEWTFDFAPRYGGTYKLYAQFVPSLSLREMIGETQIPVQGPTTASVRRGLMPYKDDGYIYSMSVSPDPLVAGAIETLTFTVRRADRGKVDLQMIMGTFAHVVAFDDGRHGVAHMHPTYTGKEHDPLSPEMSFVINFTQPGHYRVWGQVQLEGRQRFVPFDIQVAPS